jgi:hypothetical protein
MARVNSYERKGALASEDVEIVNGEQKFSMEDTANGRSPLTTPQPEISTDKVYANADLEREAFMAQVLEVQLQEAGSEDENQYAEINVNGDYKIIRRGDIGMLKRYHVAVLAQAKEQRLQQKKIVAPDGSMAYEERLVSRQTYPFTVIHDPAGRKGIDWLRQQLANPY